MMDTPQQAFESYLKVLDKCIGESVVSAPQAIIFAEALIAKANEIIIKHHETVHNIEDILVQFHEKPPTLH
tara:strand:+ start:234 stop:446 length:213 start_codon:yes stop_codon:yes gene_type:complete